MNQTIETIFTGTSTTHQSEGEIGVQQRPSHLGGGVYIYVRKHEDGKAPTRSYIAVEKDDVPALIAALAATLITNKD